jgi:beta-1,4-mannosyl-glycoprotein beta-1,4-N-acetylglucosaminyltransferase
MIEIPRIWDCFTIWGVGEMDMIEARLEFLYPYITKFVIVESKTQHDGSLKEFILEKNQERFSKYWDKVIYIKDEEDITPGLNGWNVENWHRNCIVKGITNAAPEDIIIISDLDEFPDPKYFSFLKSDRFKQGNCYGFLCDFYNYYVNIFAPLNPCVGSVVIKKQTLDQYSPQHMRNIKDKIPRLMGGWHMSYLGGAEQIYKKFMTSCDVLDKSEIPPAHIVKEILKKRLKEGQFNLRHDVDLPVFFVEYPNIPNSITKEKYPHFFLDNLDSV